MVFLILAIVSSAAISILMRSSSDKITANLSMLATNYFVCSLLGAIHGGFDLVVPQVSGFSLTVWLGLLSGVLYLTSLVLFQTNTGKNGIVLSSVFMKLGLLVPFVASVLFFQETPTFPQITGFCIAVFAIVLMNLKKDPTGNSFGLGLIVMLLLSGGADVMAKVFDVFGPETLSSLYLFYTFATAFVLCLALVIYKKEHPGFREFLYGTLIGIPNFYSARFLLASMKTVPAVIAYPTFSVGTILIVTLTGVLLFKEKLSKRQWIALAIILGALVLLNV